MGRGRVGIIVAATLLAAGGPAAARPAHSSPAWVAEKCARYGRGWTEALQHLGAAGLGPDFLAAHGRFLASGCQDRPPVCPRSPAELKMANVMVILAMNAGTASTFPPFRCAP